MAKKKALGQDPLAWIKLTHRTGAASSRTADEAESDALPAGAGPRATMNWPFLIIYLINMLLLLALVFLVHADLSSRIGRLRTEVRSIEGQVERLLQFDPASPAGRGG